MAVGKVGNYLRGLTGPSNLAGEMRPADVSPRADRGIYDAFDRRDMDQNRVAQDRQRDRLMLLAVLREIADLRALIAEFAMLFRQDADSQAPLHWDRN